MDKSNWKDRPNIVNYEWNFIEYFQDLDKWYRNFRRPKHYKIHDKKQLILRTISGKFKIWITRYSLIMAKEELKQLMNITRKLKIHFIFYSY